jgi:signal peptidase II
MKWAQAPRDASHVHSTERAPLAMSVTASYSLLLALALLVVVLDQASKQLVTHILEGRAPVPVFGGLFQLDYTRNTGAAFSILPRGGWLFAVVAVGVVVGILIFYPRLQGYGVLSGLAFGLILGGAAGNLIDRMRLGYVVDFIDFRWFPVFNLADSAIVCGVGLLILTSLLQTEGERA